MDEVEEHVETLWMEADATDQRRLLVLAGDRTAGLDAAERALDVGNVERDAVTVVTKADHAVAAGGERLDPGDVGRLLGATRDAVVLDGHEGFSPNALGRVVGAVDGGGLFVLVVPPLGEWPALTTGFDRTIAAPPATPADVAGRFRQRLVTTLHEHPGVSVVDVDAGRVVSEGPTGDLELDPKSAPRTSAETVEEAPTRAAGGTFPDAAYEACETGGQRRALRAFERLERPGRAVVVEADRGRGKSAAAGLAAASLAAAGTGVLVTAPDERGAAELLSRARTLLVDLGVIDGQSGRNGESGDGPPTRLGTDSGGWVRFAPPSTAADRPGEPDVVVVDEAAGVPVRLLDCTLTAPAVAYVTTVHGYEGAGRGFAVRFRDHLAASDHDVREVRMAEPVRYARDDPVETWAFRALLLDATPAPAVAVESATAETTSYDRLDPERLLGNEALLRETVGLLARAHYRTEPDDLARLLDAPNVSVRALRHEGRIVSVALLAREGGIDRATRTRIYEGERIRGNMIPDVLSSQLRDKRAGEPVGQRVLRIATHEAVRSNGLGSHLLDRIESELGDRVDWLGAGFGATPALCRFWERNGYGTVHLSSTRNERSGEYSAVVLRPTSDAGRKLKNRHARRFVRRAAAVLADPLDDVAPDVVREVLFGAAPPEPVVPDLTDHEWRVVAAAAFGPGIYTAAPGAFRDLALAALVDGSGLSADAERLLVRKALQRWRWDAVASDLDYASRRAAMQSFGDAYRSLVDRYGGAAAEREADRYR